MITSKQRSELRKTANGIDTIFRIGKEGVTPQLTQAIDDALAARELIKVGVLENCSESADDAARTLSGRTRSDVVQVIGRKFVLYRKKVK